MNAPEPLILRPPAVPTIGIEVARGHLHIEPAPEVSGDSPETPPRDEDKGDDT